MLALRRVGDHYNLVLIENKFDTSAIGAKAGLAKHYGDTLALIQQEKAGLIRVAHEIVRVKHALGLCDIDLAEGGIQDCEMLFVFMDYHPESRSLPNAKELIRPRYDPSVRTGMVFLDGDARVIHQSDVRPLI